MARVQVDPRKRCNAVAAHHRDTQAKLTEVAKRIESRANGNLARARATTDHEKIVGPQGLTEIDAFSDGLDRWVTMEAPSPLSIEFGHYPSGVFDPEKWGSVTKAPQGLYILTSAAWLGGLTSISSGFPRGKR